MDQIYKTIIWDHSNILFVVDSLLAYVGHEA